MRASTSLIALAASLQTASAHYYFPHLIVNGTKTPEFKYVRDVLPANSTSDYPDPVNAYNGKEAPVYGAFDTSYVTDIRCGRSAHLAASKTLTADILAGSEVGFAIKTYIDDSYNFGIFHPGPAQLWLSKSEDLSTDLGDGEWVKIGYQGPNSSTTWSTDRATELFFDMPESTPPGTYLLRLELPFPIKDWPGHSQWYTNCAHVNIIGSGGGSPGPSVKLPEAYNVLDPGINYEDGVDYNEGLENYKPPGPEVWSG
ncbi:unnamed protein product [Periconia digitata]|uniref:lytic cellulose monooxygenase (C4-dehydrogenating) n=1 Tax=Periconia digitata TaxID=1303443 RepID=A0A9W4XIN3_9PLEO|nr:unnamed protein product [Periconia digitata]